MIKLPGQSGAIHTLPLFFIVVAVGLISYLLISSTAPFKAGLFNTTNPKQASQAATSPILGTAWVNVTSNMANMPSECGNLTRVWAVPGNSNEIIAGVSQHGLWKTTNSGASWTQMGTGLNSAVITNRPSWITFDPTNSNIFYESGIYNGGGAYETTDGGNTFVVLGSSHHNDYISVDYTDPNRKTIVLGGHEQSQLVMKSTDGGQTWTNVGLNLPQTGFTSSPQIINSQTIVVNGGGSGIFRTTNGGTSWTQVGSVNAQGVPLVTANGTIYYMTGSALNKSTDQGISWTTVGNNLSWQAPPIELPDGRLVDVSNNTIVLSTDGGSTWSPIGPVMPYNPASIVYSVGDNAFYINNWDCGGVVLPNAVERLSADFGFSKNPSVSFTTPTVGQSFTTPATVNISVTATPKSPATSITNVVISQGSTTLATLPQAPYNFTWNNVTAGNYILSATATDNMGNFGSSSVNVHVSPLYPEVLNVSTSNVQSDQATIIWTTDKPGDSQVVYGTTSSYGQSSQLNSTQVTSHSVSLSGLQGSTTYHFQVKSSNSSGIGTSTDQTFTTTAPPPNPLPFTAQYWNSPTAGTAPAMPTTTPDLTRTDNGINFDWGNGSPDPIINVDHFEARWTGNLNVPTAGTYTFSSTTDDGVRLYIDGTLIIDHWIDEAPTTYTAPINLTVGTHVIKMDYYENGVGAVAKLAWSASVPTATPSPTPTPTPVPTPTPGTCPKAPLGDTDCDGVIGIFDFNNLVTNFNKTGVGLAGGDLDGNGNVDIFDFNTLVTNFGH